MDLEVCRCLSDLLMTHGGVTHCCHCDEPCLEPGRCAKCLQLNRTCSDCGTAHVSSKAAIQCEMRHPV